MVLQKVFNTMHPITPEGAQRIPMIVLMGFVWKY